jgi:hypothetical protein
MHSETRNCQNCKTDFRIEPEDFLFYDKLKVQAPPFCPTCRFKNRAVWRNEITLYNRTCVATGKNIISVYNPKSPYQVVSLDFYKSEAWDPYSFGREYDFSKPFFEQFDALMKTTYKKALFPTLTIGPNINSDYVNFAGGCKDSYFCFNSAFLEDTMYAKGVLNTRNSIDLYYNDHLEHSYECVNVYHSHNVAWAKNSTSCLDSILIENCHNCSNCFGCVNLRNQSYHFFNEKFSKEEYEEKLKEIRGSRSKMGEMIAKFEDHAKKFPKRATQNINTVNSTGDYLFDAKNSKACFESGDLEDCAYISAARKEKDSYDIIAGIGATECVDCVSINTSNRIIGSVLCANSKNIFYSFGLENCSDCIGCDGLRNAQYCILNKQYSKDEYEKIKDHIVQELTAQGIYGSMMPAWLSPFAYNETTAQDNFPMTKEQVLRSGYRWEDEIQTTKGRQTISQDSVPDAIQDVSEPLTAEILECQSCNRNYKILPAELQFYKTHILPIPTRCFYCRHKDRIARRGPCVFWDRSCAKCNKDIVTNYAPERPEIVYCETCYQQEVV